MILIMGFAKEHLNNYLDVCPKGIEIETELVFKPTMNILEYKLYK